MNKEVKMKNWFWILYPMVVVVGIFVGISVLFGGDGTRIAKITGASEELERQKAQLARLDQKERILSTVDLERETATLIRLTDVMPSTKKVWTLVSELAAAGVAAGAPLTDLGGQVNDVKEASDAAVLLPPVPAGTNNDLIIEATFAATEWSQVRSIVEQLYRAIPLLKINELTFDKYELVLVVEGAWSGWNRISTESVSPLPDITASVAQAEAKLTGFEVLPGMELGLGDFVQSANPF